MSFAHLRRTARVAECHPEREHHAKGLCRVCYQYQLNRDLRSGAKVAKPKKVTIWPQEIVRVPNMPRGWGVL